MKSNRGDLIIFAGVLCGLMLIGWKLFAPQPQPELIPDPKGIQPNYTFGSLTMAPAQVELNGDESIVAGLMDVRLWKFAIAVDKSGVSKTVFVCDLRVQEKGKPDRTLCTAEFNPPMVDAKTGRGWLYIGFRPVDEQEKRQKWILSTGGITYSRNINNPLKGAIMSGTPNSGVVTSGVPLLDARFSEEDSRGRYKTRDIVLVLKFRAKPRK